MSRHTFEPYLSRKHWTPAELAQVGFFDDGLNEAGLSHVLNDQRWITPTHHLKSCGVVLCTTGAFSPFHAGHLRMLEIAKQEIEERGWSVAGAYVIPDHDDYVMGKHKGSLPASERIFRAQLAVKDHPWIQVDPWAALYQDRPLNYTTILEHVQCMLELRGDYRVVYVFGSDNAGFKDAFHDGEYVCVERPGYPGHDSRAIKISSTEVRSGSLTVYSKPTKDCPYLLRDDLDWAVAPWGVYPRETSTFWARLTFALKDAVGGQMPGYIATEDQAAALADFKQPYVNFDRVTGGEYWISRVFQMDLQATPHDWISSDLSRIPAGRYTLIDDDIASGSTVAEIKRRTPQVDWDREISMTDWSHHRLWFDIVDARDFLFGSKCGGLWIKDGEDVYRAPYITPWVNLYTRAKIAPSYQPAFVKTVIAANVRFFEQVPVTVAQTHNRGFWSKLGFRQSTPMAEVSRELLRWNPNV